MTDKNSFSNSGNGGSMSGCDSAKGPSKITVCGTYLGGVNANRQDPTNLLYPS